MQKRMAGQLGETAKIPLRARIAGDNLEYRPLGRRFNSSLALSSGIGQSRPTASSSASHAGDSGRPSLMVRLLSKATQHT